jgi:transcriptional regulator with XRE-family HTH domain
MHDKLFITDGFIHRIRAIMEKEGISHWNEFEAEIGMRGACNRWKSGKDKPTPESLLKIKKRFHVSIDWLLTGEEPPITLQELAPTSYDARPLAPVDIELFNEVSAQVNEVLKEEKKRLEPESRNKLTIRIYNDCAEDRIKPDKVMIKRYLWLIG